MGREFVFFGVLVHPQNFIEKKRLRESKRLDSYQIAEGGLQPSSRTTVEW